MKTHNSDSIIEQRLSKNNNVQNFIHMDFFKDGEDRHGIHSRN